MREQPWWPALCAIAEARDSLGRRLPSWPRKNALLHMAMAWRWGASGVQGQRMSTMCSAGCGAVACCRHCRRRNKTGECSGPLPPILPVPVRAPTIAVVCRVCVPPCASRGAGSQCPGTYRSCSCAAAMMKMWPGFPTSGTASGAGEAERRSVGGRLGQPRVATAGPFACAVEFGIPHVGSHQSVRPCRRRRRL